MEDISFCKHCKHWITQNNRNGRCSKMIELLLIDYEFKNDRDEYNILFSENFGCRYWEEKESDNYYDMGLRALLTEIYTIVKELKERE